MSDLGGETKEIDGVRFDVGYLDTKKARRIAVRLLRAAGPAFDNGGNLEQALAHIASQPGLEDLFEDLVQDFAKVTLANDQPLVKCQEEVFKGKLLLTMKWLIFALQTNMSDFLDIVTSFGAPEAGQTKTQ